MVKSWTVQCFTLKDMTKRFLNIIYAGRKTEIEVTGFERLTEVQDKIKEKFANSLAHVDAADIQLCNHQGDLIDDLDDIGEEYYRKVKQGGACLVVSTLPAPPLLNQHGHTTGMFYGVSLYILK